MSESLPELPALAELAELSERFTFEARLGSGASGTVYRAFDRQRGSVVAVKVLTEVDAASVYRFKAEFRALTGIVHPNLVQLHDLVTRDGQWLVSMELVEGGDFLRWVRELASQPASTQEEDDADTLNSEEIAAEARSTASLPPRGDSMPLSDGGPSRRAPGALSVSRLRAALRQLVEGVGALHRGNRLHRDLKPANVLVFARDARVVICDFGLVTEVTRRDGGDGDKPKIAGTLVYMSPEQAQGQPLSEASDWYAVGVMLYQALTGQLPVSPRLSLSETVRAKQSGAFVHPCSLASDAPGDLAALALALLRPLASERPRYAEIVALLDGTEQPRHQETQSGPTRLVGRSLERKILKAAFARAWAGRATMTMIGGRSGMGKSALMQHFLDEARTQHGAVVLAGRCYEREELPYKTFDPLVDALSSYLLSLGEAAARALLPVHIGALAKLFPALRRVPAVAAAVGQSEAVDPFEQKRRAFVAFRELCRGIAEEHPLVLYIDDLQWGDLDSIPMFGELLRMPDAPSLLLVGAYRAEEEDQSPLLKALREVHFPELGVVPVEVRVDALDQNDSRELARSLLHGVADADAVAARVAEEADGSPFFVRELALHLRSHDESARSLRLDDVIAERLDDLPPECRELFVLIAAAGRPEKRSLLKRAAKATDQQLSVLEARNFVRCSGSGEDDRVEAYHDRLRDTAYRRLGDEQRATLHCALAAAIAESPEPDPEALLEHYRQCGQPELAGRHALLAAKKSEAKLAFTRAAALYRDALELSMLPGSADRARRPQVEEWLGHCLALSGRGIEAAAAFSRAVEGTTAAQSMVLRGMAMSELLRAGRVESAYEELRNARELTGVAFPRSAWAAVRMLLWRRLKVFFRRRFVDIGARGKVVSELFQRADMLWGIGATLVSMDTLRGAVYQAEHMLVALRSRDPYRLARAFAIEGTLSAARNKDPAESQYFFDRGLELAGLSGDPHATAVVKATAGASQMLEGRWRETVRLCREADTFIRERIDGTLGWELTTVFFFELQATAWIGNVREIVARMPEAIRDASTRGDLYAANSYRSYRSIWAWLGPDQLEEARRQVALAEAAWNQDGYHLQHWYTTFAFAELDLYAGEPERSLARLASEWSDLFFLRQIQYTRIEVWFTRARLLLAKARITGEHALLEKARADARDILGERVHWGFALGRLVIACATSFHDTALTRTMLQELEGVFEALDMLLLKEVARYRRGQLLADDTGEAMISSSARAIRALGVARPEAFVDMLAPGFPSVAQSAARTQP